MATLTYWVRRNGHTSIVLRPLLMAVEIIKHRGMGIATIAVMILGIGRMVAIGNRALVDEPIEKMDIQLNSFVYRWTLYTTFLCQYQR